MAFQLSSSAFQDLKPIPQKYTGEGSDISPPLKWANPPAGTKEFALVCEDPDAPSGTFVHWVAYKIPVGLNELPEAVAKRTEIDEPVEIYQGKNDFRKFGYGGPMPPKGHGLHHYHFRLFALNKKIEVAPGASENELLDEIKGHILDEADLVGVYERH